MPFCAAVYLSGTNTRSNFVESPLLSTCLHTSTGLHLCSLVSHAVSGVVHCVSWQHSYGVHAWFSILPQSQVIDVQVFASHFLSSGHLLLSLSQSPGLHSWFLIVPVGQSTFVHLWSVVSHFSSFAHFVSSQHAYASHLWSFTSPHSHGTSLHVLLVGSQLVV